MGQIPWGHVRCLLDKLDTRSGRDRYAAAAAQHGWSRNVLLNKIKTRDLTARGAAPTTFPATLPGGSDAAAELVRDPYTFDFLGLTDKVTERELEDALMHRLERFLLELGAGFAFVGRQVHLDVDGSDFYIDLLFFHTAQLRYVVLELKVGAFRPKHVGQLGFYVSAADDLVRDHSIHQRTVGILLCADRNDRVVRYSLARTSAPLAVSTYTFDELPAAERVALPTEAQLAHALATPTADEPGPAQPLDPGDQDDVDGLSAKLSRSSRPWQRSPSGSSTTARLARSMP